MGGKDAEEDFDFLVNLLASDGLGEEDEGGIGIQRGTDGKLDFGQVKAFYERKNMGLIVGGKEREGGNNPESANPPRNRLGLCCRLIPPFFFLPPLLRTFPSGFVPRSAVGFLLSGLRACAQGLKR
jgi:hypothetical protein